MELKERLHIQRLFQERGRNDINSTTLANTLDKDIQTVFNSPEKFALELLQNADDAGSQNQPVHVTFRLAQSYLTFSHTGKHFDEQDVDAICDNAQQQIGNKKVDSTKTGYKGIGFKSVFVVSDCTYIISANYTFRFDRHFPKWNSSSDCCSAYPWQIIPIWTPAQQLPKDIPIDQSQVNFLFHLNQHSDAVKQNLRDMIYTPNITLFLRHIQSITFDICGHVDVIRIVKSTDPFEPYQIYHNDKLLSLWLIMTDNIAIPQTVRHQMQQLSDQECPPKLKNAQTVTINLAYYLRQKNELNALDRATLFCYLPTQLKCGLSCLVNADFLLTADRMQLLQNDWNRFLFRCIGRFHIASLHQFAQHQDYRYSILNLLTLQLQPYFSSYFKSAYDQVVRQQLQKVALIPSQIDPNRLMLWYTAISDHLLQFYQAFPGIDPDQERNIAHCRLTSLTKLNHKFTWDNLAKKIECYASQCYRSASYNNLIIFLIDIHHQSELSTKRSNRWKDFDTKRILLADNNQLMTSRQVYLPKENGQSYPSMINIRFIHPSILNIKDSIPWLQAIGVKSIDQQCVIQEIESMIGNVSSSFTFKVSLEVIQFLCTAVSAGMICIKPGSHLYRLPLLTKSGTLKKACECYLPSILSPQFDLERLITTDIGFVAIKNYIGVNSNVLKQVLLRLGVAENVTFYCGAFIQNATDTRNIDRFHDYQTYLVQKAGVDRQHQFTYHIAYLPYMRCLNQDSYAKLFFQHVIQHQKALIQELKEFKICNRNGRKRRYNYNGQHYLHFMLNDRPCIQGTDGQLYRMNQFYAPSVIQQLGTLGQLLPQMKSKFGNVTINLPNELMAVLGARTVLTIDDTVKLFEYVTTCNRLQYFELFSNLYKVIIAAVWDQQNIKVLHRHKIKLLAADGTLQVAKSLYFIATPNVYPESHHYLLKQPNELSVQDMLIISDRLNVKIINDNDYTIQCKESKINYNMKQFIIDLLNIVVITIDDSKKSKLSLLTDWHRSLKNVDFMEVTQLVMKSSTDLRLHFKAKTAFTNQKLVFDVNSNNCKDRIMEMIGNYLKLSPQTMHILGCIHGKSKTERLEWLEERNYDINIIDSLNVDPKWNANNLLLMNDNTCVSSSNQSLSDPLMQNEVEIIPSEVGKVDFSQVSIQSKMEGSNTRLIPQTINLADDNTSVRASLRKGILSLLNQDRNTIQDVSHHNTNPAKLATDKLDNNHWTGRWGEEFMYYYFQRYYKRLYSFANDIKDSNGRFTMTGTDQTGNKLQLQVVWWNCCSESGKPYDFEIIVNNRIIYIEVKTTYKANLMRAKVSRNEWQAMRLYGKNYHLYCVFNAGQSTNIRIEVISDPASKFYHGKFNPSEMFFNI